MYWLLTLSVSCYVEADNPSLVAIRNPVNGISGQVAEGRVRPLR
jgi:hypothetical protein